MRRWAAGVLAVTALVALTACSPLHGPIEYGKADGATSAVCGGDNYDAWLFGDLFTTPVAIRIDDIALVDPDGIELIGSWLTTTPDGVIGAVDYPPTIDVDWEHAVPAAGEQVGPGTQQSFAVAVRPTREGGGRADAIAIDYTTIDDGAHFRAVGTLSVGAGDCDDED